MRSHRKSFVPGILRRAVLLLAAAFASQAFAADSSLFRIDPTKVLGPENCAECHAPMVEAWKQTHHYSTFNTTHRTPEAREIGSKMGVRRMKNESLCVKCHYTSKGASGEEEAIAGISCESCHSAGADWNKVHNNKDDPDHLAKAEKLGMIRPSNHYAVAANCFSCHTVPEEKLVNVGGHTAGSAFELVSWSQGEVRHNMQQSAGKSNPEAPIERKRMLYIVGRALDLEYGLRGLAKATEAGKYADSMKARIENATAKMKEIAEAASLPEAKAIADAANGLELKPGNAANLSKAADQIAAIAEKFSGSNDGSKLGAVDKLIPGPDQYKGKSYTP